MSKAQRNQNYIDKLKKNGKYDGHKQKRAEKMKEYRARKKAEEDEMSINAQLDAVATRRAAGRERVRQHRERAKAKANQENDTVSSASQSNSLPDLASIAYSNVQTLGKAVRKVSRALPNSPTKQKAVLARIVSNMNDDEKNELASAITSPPPKSRSVPNLMMLQQAVKEFYERDDISRVSPKQRDVKEYVCKETGEKQLLPTRHLELTIKEAYALFDEEQKKGDKGIELFWTFCLMNLRK